MWLYLTVHICMWLYMAKFTFTFIGLIVMSQSIFKKPSRPFSGFAVVQTRGCCQDRSPANCPAPAIQRGYLVFHSFPEEYISNSKNFGGVGIKNILQKELILKIMWFKKNAGFYIENRSIGYITEGNINESY